MAPSKKTKNVNRRFPNYNESSSQKDDMNLSKSSQRKRKLPNVGSQWSDEELEHFYIAYRKYGKDWKKVAGAVRNRSVEMVEALYNMNKAYLSLPEGTASVVGLIAMMTDHYNNILDGSDSEPEKTGGSSLAKKAIKRKHTKVHSNGIKEDSSSLSTASKNGALLNRIRTDGCAVRKRTPRFPVRFSCREDDNGNHVSSSSKTIRKTELVYMEDVIAKTLTDASRKRGSQVSQSPSRTEHFNSSSFRNHERKLSQTGRAGTDTRGLLDIGVGMGDVYKMGGKLYGGKEQHKDTGIKQFGGGQETIHNDVTDMKTNSTSFLGKRKRNKTQLVSGDDSLFGGLNTLVEACMMMPSIEESESSAHVQEEKETSDLAGRSGMHVASSKKRDKNEVHGATETPNIETPAPKRPRKGNKLAVFTEVIPEEAQQSLLPNKIKCFPLVKASVAADKSAFTGQHVDKTSSPQELGDSSGPAECSSSSDQIGLHNVSEISTAEVQATSHTGPTTFQRRIRKKNPVRMHIQKEIKSSTSESRDLFVLRDGAHSLKDKLSCCLSSLPLRRWCSYEWFYSAIDYPWFHQRVFVDFLNHAGFDHAPRLTRTEWGFIRSALGSCRRFSESFLNQEKEKLKQYRESVRNCYAELRAGVGEGLPADFARPLTVGQRVIAIHPKSREVHGGSVLTVDHDKYKIQFDRTELGVELVEDIACMPLNPIENFPSMLKRQSFGIQHTSNSPVILASNEHLYVKQPKGGALGAFPQAMAKLHATNAPQSPYGHPCSAFNRDADIYALTELTCALDRKEAMVLKLKGLNDEVMENDSVKDSELFRRQYDTILSKLKDASDQVSSSLVNLRLRNTYQPKSVPPFQKSYATPSVGLLPSAARPKYDQEPVCNVEEIAKDSTSKAQMMVDAALQALSMLNDGEDPFEKIGEALDVVNAKSSQQMNNNGCFKKPQPPANSEAQETSETSASKLEEDDTSENNNENLIPSKLIASCVATLLTIQKCTNRQYPPSEVAEILDRVVTDLQPSCPENLAIYRDIQLCMGRIKTQVLALVPT